jgi:hypothetical protein
MAYAICRDILGPDRTPDVQPGDTITLLQLRDIIEAATAAALASGRQADVLFAKAMLQLASDDAGVRHVLPDLISMLASRWDATDLGSDTSSNWMSAAVSQSLKGAVKAATGAAPAYVKPLAVQRMIQSCTMPDKPLDSTEADLRLEADRLEVMCEA